MWIAVGGRQKITLGSHVYWNGLSRIAPPDPRALCAIEVAREFGFALPTYYYYEYMITVLLLIVSSPTFGDLVDAACENHGLL